MESGDRPAPSLTTFRLRLVAGCVALLALAFAQLPGYLLFDTKFDLVVDPWHYLSRALHMWDSNGAIGQLQNQAYGYLWPMGPFFGVGQLLDIPGWALQRLFMALVMCVAFTGAAKVCKALGVRSDVACLVAGFAYALSPRMVTTVGTISIESWPSALAPWVLLPLIKGAAEGSPRRAAALSALAVGMVGGVNATASFGVIPVAAIWLLTRQPGPRRRALMVWWVLFTALATLWWLGPLFFLGFYSPPFLDFIEASALTTTPTSLFDALRGVSHWVPYIDARWQAGRDLISVPTLILNSGILLMLGIAGMAHRRNPHRVFLVLSLLLGLFMVGLGHTGALQGWFAGPLQSALDGPLAAARNVHKFDPVVRLPMVLGIAFLLEALTAREYWARTRSGALRPLTYASLSVLAVIAVAGAAAPAVQGRMAPLGAINEVPGYWEEAGAWLDGQGDEAVALMSPGVGVAQFVWGTPNDEPLEFLVEEGRFGVRSNIPFVPPGNIRYLDAVEERLAQGRPSAGLAPYLARAGVRFLVVRNDVIKAPDIPDTVLLHQALEQSPGIVRQKGFGPNLGSEPYLLTGEDRNVINGGWQTNYQAIEIFEVTTGGPGAVAADTLPVVVGGPESLLSLADAGLLDEQPTVLATDADAGAAPTGPVILTDGYRDRERYYGQLHDGYSATTLPEDPRRSSNAVKDLYVNAGDDRWRTRATTLGAASVTSSSAMSDSSAPGGARPGESAFAAIDGDLDTAWASQPGATRRPSWTLALDEPQEIDSVELDAGNDAPESQTLRVVTQAGSTQEFSLGAGDSRTVALPPGETRWLRLETSGQATGLQARIAEIRVPGVTARKELVLPTVPDAWGSPEAVLLEAALDARTGCVDVDLSVRCQEGRDRTGEEETGFARRFELPEAATYRAQLWVRPGRGRPVEEELLRDFPVSVTSSSQAVPDARASGFAALDGNDGTTWLASRSDGAPTLEARWVGRTLVRGIDLTVSPDAAARAPRRVLVSWRGGSTEVELDADGRARFDPVRTDFVSIRILTSDLTSSIGFDKSVTSLAAGISDLTILGAPFTSLTPSATARLLPCGSGPDVVVDGVEHPTRLTVSPAQVYDGDEVPATLCGGASLPLAAGEHQVTVDNTDVFTATRMTLVSPDYRPGTSTAVPWESSDADSRTAEPPAGADVLAFRENGNHGWRGAQDGEDLTAVRIDGWQQGWLLDETASGPVTETYGPERLYRSGLLVGALTLIGLLALVLFWWRRPPSSPAAPVGTRILSGGTWTILTTVSLGLIAGWPGAVLALTGVLAVRRWGAPGDAWSWTAGLLVLGAAVYYAFHAWGAADGWGGTRLLPQLAVLLAMVLVVSSAARPSERSRIAGSSTKR
ncbi:alpha-(1-_3)-arabinofuranosyltransferase domain-containing protein [Nocardioides zhouii]|uniref:alpha-(1->3)-arabinofuranosyltransferase domain-containing protein n=1 Tax=Nocardioides zhouii TaxID=1168729 RepID=UPI0013ECEBA8|nr:alpha-(1->3)-arabinofuranosyltransferase family protein [Nocardioides zhouii]